MNSNSGGEGEIRKNLIEAGLVDCMVALPAQLFYNTMIPACLWFLAKNRRGTAEGNRKLPTPDGEGNRKGLPLRNRENEILFIDARNLGTMINRRNKELSDADIQQITDTYHNWRNIVGAGLAPAQQYSDIAGFCKAATIDEVRQNNYVLMPGRYVGTEEEEIDLIPFEQKMQSLTATLAEQFAQGAILEQTIRENLKGIGYEF
jgi:type I restriction enzyme M protein